jgi:hypothetical protein
LKLKLVPRRLGLDYFKQRSICGAFLFLYNVLFTGICFSLRHYTRVAKRMQGGVEAISVLISLAWGVFFVYFIELGIYLVV